MGWAQRAKLGQDALEAAVERAIKMPDAEYTRRSAAARQWYLDNDLAFRRRLAVFAARLTDTVPSTASVDT